MKQRSLQSVDAPETEGPASDRRNGSPGVADRRGGGPVLPLVIAASDNPVELGRVSWRRGFDDAAAEARRLGRPLLVLFDEVPG